MQPALTVPRSTLMHTSLALSDASFRTLDSIISSHHAYAATSRLPVEVLLLIRTYLLVYVTDDLIIRSNAALQRYESSLGYLLCPECRAYNQDVFGTDIWQWEQFSGACACYTTRLSSIPLPIFAPPTLNPKKFSNRQHWLEFYLSMKAQRLIQTSPSSSSKPRDIWDLISSVLEIYGCQSVHGRDACTEDVLIVPRRLDDFEDSIILKRAERDLALSVDYTVLKTRSFQHSLLSFSRGFSLEPGSSETGVGILDQLVNSLLTIFLAALSIPLSIATLFLVIICFYSRPWAFRIL